MKRDLILVTVLILILMNTAGCSVVRFAENATGYGVKRTSIGPPEIRRAQLSRQDLELGIRATDSGLSLQLRFLPYYHLEERQTFTSRAQLTGIDIAVGLASAGLLGWVAYDNWKGDGIYVVSGDGSFKEGRSFDWEGAALWQKAVMVGIPTDFAIAAILHTLPGKGTTPWEQKGEEKGTPQWLKNHPYRLELPGYDLGKDYRTTSGDETIAIREFLDGIKNPAPFLQTNTLQLRAFTEFEGKPYEQTLTLTGTAGLKPFYDFAHAAAPEKDTAATNTPPELPRQETIKDTVVKETPPDPTPPIIVLGAIPMVKGETQQTAIQGSVTSEIGIQDNRIFISNNGKILPPKTLDPNGEFTLYISLNEGNNQITLAAIDSKQQHAEEVVDIYRPMMPPEIEILELRFDVNNVAEIRQSTQQIRVRVTDASNIEAVTLNGREMEPTLMENIYVLESPPVVSQSNFTVSAVDAHGNPNSKFFTLTYRQPDDTPPTIQQKPPSNPVVSPIPPVIDTSPAEREDPRLLFVDRTLEDRRRQTINRAVFTLKFVVIDESPIKEVVVTRRNDGTTYPVSEIGGSDYTADLQLNEGENIFEIKVTDKWDNHELETLTLTRVQADTTAPRFLSLSVGEDSQQVQRIPIRGGDLINTAPIVVSNVTTVIRGSLFDDSGIDSVDISVNNNPLEPPALQQGTRFQKTLPLDYGQNRIRITATDAPGNSGETEFTIYQRPDRDRKDFALFFATNIYSGKKNNDRPPQWENLKSPIREAKAISKNLQDNYGFQTRIFPNLKKREVLETLHKYSKTFDGTQYVNGSQLLIFFSGHGYYNEARGKGYLITADTDHHEAGDPTLITALSHEDLREEIKLIKCPRILVSLDTCFSGTFDPNYKPPPPLRGHFDGKTLLEQLELKLRLEAKWCLTAAGVEFVADGDTGRSPFATAFLNALNTKGGQDFVLTLDEVWQVVEKSKDAPVYDRIIKEYNVGRPQPRKGQFGNSFKESDFLFFPIVQ